MRQLTRRGWFFGAVLWCVGLTSWLPAGEGTWKVGLARACITPQEPLWMAGYAARTRPAEGAIHDLWVKVLALEDGRGQRGVVVTSDLLGFPRDVAQAICEGIQQRCGLRRAQIMLTSSHTHSGPVIGTSLWDCYPLDETQKERIRRYTARLEKAVVAAVAEACSRRQPATLWAGQGTAGFAVNRRNNRANEVPELREAGKLRGPSDHRVPVLAVRSPEGRLLAVVFGYACHNTTLAGYDWCGDYAGFAQLALEEKYPELQAMFYSGCGADQNPLPRRSVELCRQYGEQLAVAVQRVLEGDLEPLDPQLATAWKIVRLRYGQQPTREELAALASGANYRSRWARRLLGELDAGQRWETDYPYPVQVWRLGRDQLWIVLGGEVVVDYALRFANQYGPRCWVAAYANDVMAYIPSHRVWEEGGYESGAFPVYGLPAQRWEEGIEEKIAAAVAELAEQVGSLQPAGSP